MDSVVVEALARNTLPGIPLELSRFGVSLYCIASSISGEVAVARRFFFSPDSLLSAANSASAVSFLDATARLKSIVSLSTFFQKSSELGGLPPTEYLGGDLGPSSDFGDLTFPCFRKGLACALGSTGWCSGASAVGQSRAVVSLVTGSSDSNGDLTFSCFRKGLVCALGSTGWCSGALAGGQSRAVVSLVTGSSDSNGSKAVGAGGWVVSLVAGSSNSNGRKAIRAGDRDCSTLLRFEASLRATGEPTLFL